MVPVATILVVLPVSFHSPTRGELMSSAPAGQARVRTAALVRNAAIARGMIISFKDWTMPARFSASCECARAYAPSRVTRRLLEFSIRRFARRRPRRLPFGAGHRHIPLAALAGNLHDPAPS